MRQTGKGKGARLRIGWLLLLVLATPGLAQGAEFSARVIVKDSGKIMPGKIYVRDGLMRHEFVDEKGTTVTMVRPDQQVVWVILPQQRIYMEMPLKTTLPGQFIQIPPLATARRLVGKERLSGYDTEKYEVNVPMGRGLESQTFWVATVLGLPIKMEARRRQFSMEYQGIKEEKVPERLFNLPPGCQKVTSLGSFADKVQD